MIVNKAQLAEIHSVTDRTLTDWAKHGMPIRSVGGPGRGNENLYDTAETIEWRIQRAVSGYQVESAKERKERLEGDRIELMLAREAGLLVAVEEVEPLWAQAILAAKSELMEGIYRLKTTLDATFEIDVDVAMLEDHFHQALSKLADHPPLPDETRTDPANMEAADADGPDEEGGGDE